MKNILPAAYIAHEKSGAWWFDLQEETAVSLEVGHVKCEVDPVEEFKFHAVLPVKIFFKIFLKCNFYICNAHNI